MARRNSGTTSSIYGNSTCSSFISGSICGSSVGSSSSRNRSIIYGMERPGVVVVNSIGSRGGASLAVVVMAEAKGHKQHVLYSEASLSMVLFVYRM